MVMYAADTHTANCHLNVSAAEQSIVNQFVFMMYEISTVEYTYIFISVSYYTN